MCGHFFGDDLNNWQCSEMRRVRQAMVEMSEVGLGPDGPHERPTDETAAEPLPMPQAKLWAPLEGQALSSHPDPLGALQRGEVPALVIRGLLGKEDLQAMYTRMADFASAGSKQSRAVAANCAWLAGAEGVGDPNATGSTHGSNTSSIPAGGAAGGAAGLERAESLARACLARFSQTKSTFVNFGSKLGAQNFGARGFAAYTAAVGHEQGVMEEFSKATCSGGGRTAVGGDAHGAWCSPFDAMAHGLSRLAKLSRRRLRVAWQGSMAASNTNQSAASSRKGAGKDFVYPSGLLRSMRPGFRYVPHFDSKHSDLWMARASRGTLDPRRSPVAHTILTCN